MAQPDLSRRDLILHAGATLAAAAMPAAMSGAVPLSPPDKQPPDLKVPPGAQKPIGFAVVGLGQLALEEVMPAFGLCEHARPVALVSGHPDKAQKVADFYGIEGKRIYNYQNFDQIRDDPAIQAVYIILPNSMHAEYTIRALQAGKHVLCEKPMAANSQEARQMIAAAKKADRKLMIAYRMRYEPFNQKAIELIRGGEIGKVRVIEAQNMQNTEAPNIRLSKSTAGGPLGDVGIYCLNAFRYLTGEEPVEVQAMQHQPSSEDPRFSEVPENVSFQMWFPSGVLAMGMAGFGSHESRRYRVTGSKGWIGLDPAFGYYGQELKLAKEKLVSKIDLRPKNHFAAEMDHFCECILNHREPLTPGEEGLKDMIIIEKITEAAIHGGRIKVGELV